MARKFLKTRTYSLSSGIKIRFEIYYDNVSSASTIQLENQSPPTEVIKMSVLNMPFEVVPSSNKLRFATFKLKFVDISNVLTDLSEPNIEIATNTNLGNVFLDIFITQPIVGTEEQIWAGILVKNRTKKSWTRPRTNVNEYEHIEFLFEERFSQLKQAVYSDIHTDAGLVSAANPLGYIESQSIYDYTVDISDYLELTTSFESTYAIREHQNYTLSSGSNSEGATANLFARHIAINKPVLSYYRKWMTAFNFFATTIYDQHVVFDRTNRPICTIDTQKIMKYIRMPSDTIEYIEMKHSFGFVENTTGSSNDRYISNFYYSTGSPSPISKNNIKIDLSTKNILFGTDLLIASRSDFETETWWGIDALNELGGLATFPGGGANQPLLNAGEANQISIETASFNISTNDNFINEGMFVAYDGPTDPQLQNRHALFASGSERIIFAPSQSLPFSGSDTTEPEHSGSKDNFADPVLGVELKRRTGASPQLENSWNRKVMTVLQTTTQRLWEYYHGGERIKLKLDSVFFNPTASVSLNNRIYVPINMKWNFMDYTSEFEMREVSASSVGTADWLGGRPTQSFDSRSFAPEFANNQVEGKFIDFFDKTALL